MSNIAALARLLRPESIAIVGASKDPMRMGAGVIPGLMEGGYTGKIFPVNKGNDEIGGHRCYASIEDIPETIDHCIIAIGREQVAGVLEQCRRKNVGGASIWSSGFAELDEAGRAAQLRLRETAGDMPFLGPNCMGFANLGDRILACSAPLTLSRDPGNGDIALISQSGGLGFASIGYFASQRKMAFSYVVNTGNSAGVSYGDLLEFLFDDARTRVIMAVVEAYQIADEMIERVRALGLRKPVILLKVGRGPTGAQMTLSHTGSQAGDYGATRDAAEKVGIVCADDIDELLDGADLLRHGFTGWHADNLSALSISGGNITLFADHADAQGLRFAELERATNAKLRELLPDYITVHNPIDITGLGVRNHDLHGAIIETLAKDAGVRTVIPILTNLPTYRPVANILADVKARTGCAFVVLWTGGSFEEESEQIIRAAGIPIFRLPSRLASTFRLLRRASDARPARTP